MTATDPTPSVRSGESVDAVLERLDDPAVAASLVTLLDHAELLSTLVLGLSGFVARSETIVDAVAEGVNDFKASVPGRPADLPSLGELGIVASELSASAPALQRVLNSSMVDPDTIDLLSLFSEAATDGAATARVNGTKVGGIRGLYSMLRDDDVQRGLGLIVEIARALGQRIERPGH